QNNPGVMSQAIPPLTRLHSEPMADLRIPGPPAASSPSITVPPAAAKPSVVQGSAPVPSESPIDHVRELYRDAAQRYAAIDSYIVRLRRREQVNGKDQPEELLLVKFRKQPTSVYFKWLGKEGHGREVVYV